MSKKYPALIDHYTYTLCGNGDMQEGVTQGYRRKSKKGRTGTMFCYDSPEYVKDMGTPERFHQVEEDFKKGSSGKESFPQAKGNILG